MGDTTTTTEAYFQCKYCLRAYERTDLLSHHQRRCNMTGRVSKQKACSNCVRTKSKCSFTQPICHRCSKRNEPCEYPKSISTTNRGRVNSSNGSSEVAKDHEWSAQNTPPSRFGETGRKTIDNGLPSPPCPSRMEPSELDWNLDTELMDQSFWIRLNENPPGTLSPTGSVRSMTRSTQMSLQSPAADIMVQQDLMQPFDGQFPPNSHGDRDHTHGALTQWNLITNESPKFSLMDLDMIHRPSISEASDTHILRGLSGASSTTTNQSVVDTAPMFAHNHHQPRPSIIGSLSPPISPGSIASRDFNHKSLLRIVKNYLKLLQLDEYRSPFIHPELYHGTHHHLSSMQKSSMATCSAAALENRRSKQFVRKAIAAEREKLVQDFHLYSSLQEWDALHAMCIYQITDLVDIHEEADWKPGVSPSWLHIPFLLKMTRRFSHNHSQTPSKNSPPSDTPNVDWLTWTIKETVLRTIFLVHFINEATGHLHEVVSPYYEPLDGEGFLNMSLPSPRAMWEATTAEEWRIQRDRCRWIDGRITVRKVLEAEDWTLDSYTGGHPGVGDSKELTDLVIACGALARGSR